MCRKLEYCEDKVDLGTDWGFAYQIYNRDSLHCVFLAYKLQISPLPVCELLVSTTSEGCPYNHGDMRTDINETEMQE